MESHPNHVKSPIHFTPETYPPRPPKEEERAGWRVNPVPAGLLALLLAWIIGGSLAGYRPLHWLASDPAAPLSSSPTTSELTPEQRVAYDALVKFIPDPASLQVIEWGPTELLSRIPSPAPRAGRPCDRAVTVLFRHKNGMGNLTVESAAIYMKDGKVVSARTL